MRIDESQRRGLTDDSRRRSPPLSSVSAVTEFLTTVADEFGPTLLAAALFAAFAESALGVGSLLPGEAVILALSASVAAPPQALWLVAAVAVGAIAGDHTGYLLGRSQSTTIRTSRPISRIGVPKWDRAAALVHRHGALAVVASRLFPVVRTLTPAVAGATALPYRIFWIASATGSVLWAGLWVAMGTAGSSLIAHAGRQLGPVGVAALVLVAASVAALLVLRRRRLTATAPTIDFAPGKDRR